MYSMVEGRPVDCTSMVLNAGFSIYDDNVRLTLLIRV